MLLTFKLFKSKVHNYIHRKLKTVTYCILNVYETGTLHIEMYHDIFLQIMNNAIIAIILHSSNAAFEPRGKMPFLSETHFISLNVTIAEDPAKILLKFKGNIVQGCSSS